MPSHKFEFFGHCKYKNSIYPDLFEVAVSGGVKVQCCDKHLFAAESRVSLVPAGDPHDVGRVAVEPGHGELTLRHGHPRVQVAAERESRV